MQDRINDLEEELLEAHEHGSPDEIRKKAKEELQDQVKTILENFKNKYEDEQKQLKDEIDEKDDEIMNYEKQI